MSEHHWISTAIKHHGALRASAKRAGMSSEAYAHKHKGDAGVQGHRARLALTLMHLHKHDSTNEPAAQMDRKTAEQEAQQ